MNAVRLRACNALLENLGMPQPQNTSAFIALGVINDKDVIEKNIAGVMFLAWRCIYAAIVTSRIEQKPLETEKAYKRLISMLISRYTAEAEFWKSWVQQAHFSYTPRIIPQQHREKVVYSQDMEGYYEISSVINEG